MRIEVSDDERSFFVFRNASGRARQYFSFYVDDDKSSWTEFESGRARFISRREAAEVIIELRRRANVRRKRSRSTRG